jgi:hypothetical protein
MGFFTETQYATLVEAIKTQDELQIAKAALVVVEEVIRGNVINTGQHATLHKLLCPDTYFIKVSNCPDCAKRAVAHWRGQAEFYRKQIIQLEQQQQSVAPVQPQPESQPQQQPQTQGATEAETLVAKVGQHRQGQQYQRANHTVVTLLGWHQDRKTAVVIDASGNKASITKNELNSYTCLPQQQHA